MPRLLVVKSGVPQSTARRDSYHKRYGFIGTNPTAGLGLAASSCNSGLAGKPFTKQVRQHLPRKRSGDEGVQYAVEPAWNDSGAVFEQTAEALRYALPDAHRFRRHSLRIEGELFVHRCVRNPGCQYSSDVDT